MFLHFSFKGISGLRVSTLYLCCKLHSAICRLAVEAKAPSIDVLKALPQAHVRTECVDAAACLLGTSQPLLSFPLFGR